MDGKFYHSLSSEAGLAINYATAGVSSWIYEHSWRSSSVYDAIKGRRVKNLADIGEPTFLDPFITPIFEWVGFFQESLREINRLGGGTLYNYI